MDSTSAPTQDVIGIAIVCPDCRLPGRAARTFMAAAPEVEKVHPGPSVFSPEQTLNDDEGLQGVLYQLRKVFRLYPGRHLRIGVFGHRDCKANPISESQRHGEIVRAAGRLYLALATERVDFVGTIEIAGYHQDFDENGKFVPDRIVQLTSHMPIVIEATSVA